ncbi:MAG: hypothetical protein SWH61_05240 [Thermodesulfobacteriota bacterium]|nr:hypothetical protein [Thermodesulfobacteriota bacterium]
MGQANGYPLNESPADIDQLLGIDDPDGDWSVQRFSVSALLASVRARIEQMEMALNENDIYPGEIVFHTSGATFEPAIVLYDGSTATVEWTFSDGSTSDSLTPSADFGTAGSRVQRLKVTPWSDLYRINVGYDAADGGALDIEQIPQQNVTAIENLHLVAGTLVDFCGNNTPITTMDFSNFLSLDTIELYGADLVAINIYNTPVLQRLQVESTSLAELDMSTSPNLGDIRASSNPYTYVNFGDTTFDNLWHICMRDTDGDYVIDYPTPSNMPNIMDLYIWNTNQTGAGSFTGLTALRCVRLFNNEFTSLDFTGSFSNGDGGGILEVYGNSLTNLTITGCTDLHDVDASNNALLQSAVDHVLTTLDANGRSGGTVNLSGGTNAGPSASGLAAQASLAGKGWTVTLNDPDVPMLSSATIGADGDTWTLVFTEAVNIGSGGSGGFAITMTDAGVVELTYSSGEGSNTLIYTGDVTVQAGDTVASGLDYTQPGDGIENTTGFDLETFTGESIVNSSTVGPPALTVATLGADGMTWTFEFSRAVTIGTGGNGGFGIEFTAAGVVALSYGSGDGTDTLTYTGDAIVERTDTVVDGLNYTQPGDGIEANDDGTDLTSFTDHAIVNNSALGDVPISIEQFDAQSWNDVNAEDISWDAGDTVVVFCGCWGGDPLGFSVNDGGDDYTAISGSLESAGSASLGWFYQRKTSAGSGTVTFTDSSGGSNYSIRTYVLAGIAGPDPVDFAVNSGNDAVVPFVSPVFTTTHDNVIVLMGYHHNSDAPTERILTPDTYIWDSNVMASPQRPCCHQIFNTIQTGATVAVTPDAGVCAGMSVIGLIGAAQ